jgi:hypothetical protein
MNTMTFTAAAPGMPRFAPVRVKRVHSEARVRPKPMRKRITLDRGNVLRIHDGQGARLKVTSGVLWITEEECTVDTVLVPGESYRLVHGGLALALAHRPARVMLEVPAGVAAPGLVDIALADGEPVRRVVLGRKPLSLIAVAKAIHDAIRRWAREALSPRQPVPYY